MSTPAGIDKAGRPAKFTGTVKISFKYIETGSFVFSPILNAELGVDDKGHPLGLQLIGKALDEQKLLNIGYAFEKNCGFKNEIKKWWS